MSGRKARPEVREVTAMELAGAQVNADEQSSGERRGTSEQASLRFQTKGSPIMEDAQPRRPPGAQEPICPAVPSPIPALESAPPSSPGGGGTRWHRLLRGGGPKSPQQLVEGNAQLWEGGQRIQCGGRPEPHASLPAHPPQGCTAPPPQPLAPQAPAQGPEVRGRPPLVVCLEGRGERGEAHSGPGGGPDRELHHSCLRVFQP